MMTATRTHLCRAPYCREQVGHAMEVCDLCWEYRSHWRANLIELYLRAQAALPPGKANALADKVSGSAPTSSMPLREGPLMAMECALNLMETWAHVLLRRGCPGHMPERGKVRDGHLFARAVGLCAVYDHELTHSPLMGDYFADLYKAYWRLARVDNRRADVVSLRRPCPSCDRVTCIERNAGEYVLCLTCGAEWSQASYAALTRGGTP